MPQNDEEKTINTHHFSKAAAQGAAIDVKVRSDAAYEQFPEFFDDPDHAARVDTARKILEDFFPVKDIYENMRANRGKPFTVLKVTNHVFPRVSFKEKDARYRKPLEELGVKIIFSKNTNSYLYRVF